MARHTTNDNDRPRPVRQYQSPAVQALQRGIRKPPETSTPNIVFRDAAHCAIDRGVDQLVRAIRPTLGPLPRLTAISRAFATEAPEILDDGATIARRVTGLADRDADMGAMLLRHALWRLHEEVGDGTASCAVVFRAILAEGRRYVAGGNNAMRLKAGLERGLRVAMDALSAIASPLDGQRAITGVAQSICHDRPLAEMLGEIFDLVGPYGCVSIRDGNSRELQREYVAGAYWEAGWLSPHMNVDPLRLREDLYDAVVLVTDLEISDLEALAALLRQAVAHDVRSLVVMGRTASESAISLMVANRNRGNVTTLAVNAPKGVPGQTWALEDIAVLTGAHPYLDAAGDRLTGVRWEHLGRARRVWATKDHIGVSGGQGDARRLRAHIAALRAVMPRFDDLQLRRQARERIGRLMGGSATLWVGADTDTNRTFRKETAERTATALRAALSGGVVPGAGVALLATRRALQQLSGSEEERVAFRILARALEAPARQLLSNAGYDVAEWLPQLDDAAPDCGLDVLTGRIVDLRQAGILDALDVQRTALRNAVTTAILALTTDILVHSSKPEQSLDTS